MGKKKKFFKTKAEAWLTLISILEILLFLFSVLEYAAVWEELLRTIITSVISILCSIFAAMWVPKVVQEEPYQELGDSIVERVTSEEKRLQDEAKEEFRARMDHIGREYLSTVQESQDTQTKVFQGMQEAGFQRWTDDLEKRIRRALEVNRYVQPSEFYKESDKPHPELNEKMNDKIIQAEEYFYFSDRALFLSERLGTTILNRNPVSMPKITILLADVEESSLFEARWDVFKHREQTYNRDRLVKEADNRQSSDAGEDNAKEEYIINKKDIIDKEKMKVLQSLYALGRLRDKYDMEIYLHKEIPFIRFEIIDDLLVLSFLPQLGNGKRFPPTVTYERDTIFTPNFRSYVEEAKERARRMDDTDLQLESLLELGIKAGVEGCDAKTVVSHYEQKIKTGNVENV